MPRVGPLYTLPVGYLAVTGEVIQPSQHNPPLEDIAEALTDSLPRNGTGPMTGALAMGSNKITGLAAGTNAGDAVRFDQVGAWLTSVSALALAADEMVYANGVNTAAKTALTAFARTLLDDADAATARTTLDAQESSANLTALAATTLSTAAVPISSNDDDTHVPTNAAVIDYVDERINYLIESTSFPSADDVVTEEFASSWVFAELVIRGLSLSGSDNLQIQPAQSGFPKSVTASSKVLAASSFTSSNSGSAIVIPIGSAALTVSGFVRMRRPHVSATPYGVVGEYRFRRSDDVIIDGVFEGSTTLSSGAVEFIFSSSGSNTIDAGSYRLYAY